ncbi:MAG TPA: nucleotidyltransferase family protein, partial [Methanoregulaceae archaeon]|nr:nucleotidyltransferase family protein [Methanoregulaceae archaeon]
DIDLLVRPGDVLAAEAVLEDLGYHRSEKGFVVSQHQYNHDVFEPPGRGNYHRTTPGTP